MLKVVILAGGRGERFWPLSRRARPKPFLALGTRDSLLRETIRRARGVAPPGAIRVVAGGPLAAAVRRELRGLGIAPVLVEPAARNTGPAALLAAREIGAGDPRSEILTLPSDHRVTGQREFRRAVAAARKLARRGFLVTFGIAPEGPNPDYGYIVRGGRLGPSAFRVERFVEKPEAAAARRLIRREGAAWNSGMFVWRADVFLEEAARCHPAFRRWLEIAGTAVGIPAGARRAFERLRPVPVDRAVLERSRRVAVVLGRFRWSDLGSWSSLAPILSHGAGNNLSWGKLAALDSRHNLAVDPGGLTVLSGVRDLLVVHAGDVTLVCPRSHAARIREILGRLERMGHVGYL
jgi:mannose-1-phosphate guanylyltransferase/mannose-6-phosphate isomerase